jgi:SAM-dependent methyltransferase
MEPVRVERAEVEFLPFSSYFPHTPTALCVRECIRLSKLAGYPCRPPILDVGCGDGLFAKLAFKSDDVWGIDIDAVEGRWAQASKAYSQIIIGDIAQARFPESFFHTCVANCSLEHIPDARRALQIIKKALVPGGVLYLFLPAKDWTESLRSVRAARRVGANWLADAMRSGLDGVFRHHHLYDEATWIDICTESGFELMESSPLGSVAATQAFEAFLPQSLISLASKKLTGRWTLVPSARRLLAFPIYLLVELAFRSSDDATPTAEYFIALRKPTG